MGFLRPKVEIPEPVTPPPPPPPPTPTAKTAQTVQRKRARMGARTAGLSSLSIRRRPTTRTNISGGRVGTGLGGY